MLIINVLSACPHAGAHMLLLDQRTIESCDLWLTARLVNYCQMCGHSCTSWYGGLVHYNQILQKLTTCWLKMLFKDISIKSNNRLLNSGSRPICAELWLISWWRNGVDIFTIGLVIEVNVEQSEVLTGWWTVSRIKMARMRVHCIYPHFFKKENPEIKK